MKRRLFLSILTLSIFSAAFWMVFAQAQPETKADVWRGHEKGVTDLAFSPTGEWLASSGLDGAVRLWNVKSGKPERVIHSQTDEIYALEFSRDGQYIASTGYDGRIVVTQVKTGKIVQTLSGFKGWSPAVAFSPDARQIAAAGTDGKIWIWEVESGKQIHTLESKQWQIALAWSPDGKYLASASAGLTLWDAATGQEVKKFTGHTSDVRSIVFSPDGKLMASASHDRTAKIWNVESGKNLFTIEPIGFSRLLPEGRWVSGKLRVPVLAVAFSPDGKQLATGGADRFVQLWDVASGNHLRSMQGHTMTITGVAFSPDGKRVASSSLDRTIRFWEIGN